MLESKKTMCKDCCYCEFAKGNGNPNRYYCTNAKAAKDASRRLICRTERHSTEITIKTRPRWCQIGKDE